jgi:hypothetical protein
VAEVADRPTAVLEHIGMPAMKQPFAACGNLSPNV